MAIIKTPSLPPPSFYWAYGSNLSFHRMRQRCPMARPYSPLILDDGHLIFRGVADCVFTQGGKIAGGLYRVTPQCIQALDRYEGVSIGVYKKKYLRIKTKGKEHRVIYYQMTIPGIMPPSEIYLDQIVQGYRDFDLDDSLLDEAVRRSWDNKDLTAEMRTRYLRRGKPPLAMPSALSIFEE